MNHILQPYLSLSMTLGEALLWHESLQALFWVDIAEGQLHRLDWTDNHHQVIRHDEEITCIAHTSTGKGFVGAFRSGLWLLDDQGQKRKCLVDLPADTQTHRFNDGGCDPAGRFWIGTINEVSRQADAALYSYNGQQLVQQIGGMTITNGLAFSPDGRWLYHTDTPTRIIRRHAFDVENGQVGPGQKWVDLNELNISGYPDGAAVDSQGHYWTALFGGAAVARFDPEGQLVAHYPINALQPTMTAFGGPDMKTLFVTTARENMSSSELARWPDSGALLAMPVEVPGRPMAAFQFAC